MMVDTELISLVGGHLDYSIATTTISIALLIITINITITIIIMALLDF